MAHLSEIHTKEGGDHAFNPRGADLDRSWGASLARQLIHPHGGLHQGDLECGRHHCRGLVAPEHFWAHWRTPENPSGEVTVWVQPQNELMEELRLPHN